MIPFAQHLQNAYFHANAAHIANGKGRLRKGEFMQNAYPKQKYGNEASARRQYNKIIKGSIPGTRIEKRGRLPFRGIGTQAGLWQVFVHLKHMETDGSPAPLWPCKDHICIDDEHSMERSFVMSSFEYTRLEDMPYIYEILPPLVEAKIQEWLNNGSLPPIYWEVATLVTPMARTNLPGSRQVSLDNVEIE